MPDITDRFTQASRDTWERERRRTVTPVTKKELKDREALRSSPAPTLHMEPGGTVQRRADSSRQLENNRRIKFLQERLGRMKSRARDDFKRVRR